MSGRALYLVWRPRRFDDVVGQEVVGEAADPVGGGLHLVLEVGEQLLARRLVAAVEQVSGDPEAVSLPVGLFGASTGAAAALVASVSLPGVAAIVSRGGRPDLAGDALEGSTAPTLLIVGGSDFAVIELNKQALNRLKGPKALEIVPGATHLFEEPGAMDAVIAHAGHWFEDHLRSQPRVA